MHQGPPPGCEKDDPYSDVDDEDDDDDEDEDDYAVRQPIRPHDGVSDSVLVSFTI